MKCKHCDSTNVWHFRLDSDWGSGGDYTQHGTGDYKDRPDVEVDICENCWRMGDDLLVPV